MSRWAIPFALVAVVIAAAELLEMRAEIYAGAAAGLLFGLVGFAFRLRIVAQHKGAAKEQQRDQDIWGLWGGGLLARLALLGPLCWLFSRLPGFQLPGGLLSLTGVYLVLLFWEAHWLAARLTGNHSDKGYGPQPDPKHG